MSEKTGGATETAIKPTSDPKKVATALTAEPTEPPEVSSAALTALESAKDAILAEAEDIDVGDTRQVQFYEQAVKATDQAIREVTAALTEAAAAEAAEA